MNGKILYKEICEDIISKINSGEYKNGDFLPSQEELCKKYNVSLITVKKALKYAEDLGVVVRCKGKRTQISNVNPKIIKHKILLLDITGKNRESMRIKMQKKQQIVLNVENSWHALIKKSLLSALPPDADVLTASYYSDEILEDYENTIIPNYDRIALLGRKSSRVIEFLKAKGKEIVVFGNTNIKGCAIVANNDREISRCAVKYLISLGHRRIAFIGTNTGEGDFSERYKGYQEALLSSKLMLNGYLLRWCNDATADEGYNAMQDILFASYSYGRPTAVFCGNDNLAYGALTALQASGFECPKDISVIGVDNYPEICKITQPNLSSVDKNFSLAGIQIAKVLCRENWQDDISIIKCDLVIRDSVMEVN